MKQNVLASLAVAVLLVLLAACSSSPAKNSPADSGAASNAASTTPEADTTAEEPAESATEDPKDRIIKLLANTPNHNDEVAPILATELEKLGYTLEFEVPTDSIIANKEVLEGFYDVAIGNHTAALNAFNEANNGNLVPAFLTTFAPNGIYSKKYASFDELPDGATISIPGDQANGGRPLIILQDAGLIKLKEGVDLTKLTPSDIIDNPRQFKFKTLDTAVLLRALDDLDAGFLYQSQRVKGGLALEDALGLESNEYKDFYIIAATRPELVGTPKLEALKQAYYSDAVKEFYKTRYDEGSIFYAW
ncbi:hypothetical protein PA598K_03014 [Paenibacillus sp. 598K]|uniref:MetQ/NlpA family ABC transporter substrate-binding protein n=1 Tax=Paenibacillus sp. 598K TaxID=1117987 RepID=UPI000FFA4721|nr:MetQ/NlpA family ABC transporter substrate-binding protein [Paenibacillus sp. 598K]GBF74656.1 hypothetical protein PA598K_03014 [Paenibacillus sp. 598K]